MKVFISNLFVVIFTILAVSCSNDNTYINPNAFIDINNPELEEYLSDYYKNQNFTLGESTESNVEGGIIIQEIVLINNQEKVSYAILDNETSELLYFAEIDKGERNIYAMDFKKDEEVSLTNIKESRLLSKSFSMPDEINSKNSDLSGNGTPRTTLQKAKFWGWTCGDEYTLPNGDCLRNCTYHILFIPGETEIRTCENLPGRYKN